ncbi:MAG: hypothetical protein LBU06_04275 [Desulfovibrio sp.]|nr:hypothetical protein [Desulfovibrio sp.]
MNIAQRFSIIAAVILATAFGAAGVSYAHGRHDGREPGRYVEYNNKIAPLQQQLYAKRTELDAFFSDKVPQTDAKVQGLIKEIGELYAKIYAVNSEYGLKGDPACPPSGYGYPDHRGGPGGCGGGPGWGHGGPGSGGPGWGRGYCGGWR